jgi:Sec-independent protein translocase protein TatA
VLGDLMPQHILGRIGLPELIVLFAVAILLFGMSRLHPK